MLSFFEPFPIDGRNYVDDDLGHTGHADVAVEWGATIVVLVNPAVPLRLRSLSFLGRARKGA